MASKGKGHLGSTTSHDSLNETPGGVCHTADSLSNPPHGEYIDRFGPPGDPTQTPKYNNDKRLGKSPQLLKKFQNNTRQK